MGFITIKNPPFKGEYVGTGYHDHSKTPRFLSPIDRIEYQQHLRDNLGVSPTH